MREVQTPGSDLCLLCHPIRVEEARSRRTSSGHLWASPPSAAFQRHYYSKKSSKRNFLLVKNDNEPQRERFSFRKLTTDDRWFKLSSGVSFPLGYGLNHQYSFDLGANSQMSFTELKPQYKAAKTNLRRVFLWIPPLIRIHVFVSISRAVWCGKCF